MIGIYTVLHVTAWHVTGKQKDEREGAGGKGRKGEGRERERERHGTHIHTQQQRHKLHFVCPQWIKGLQTHGPLLSWRESGHG